MTRTILLLATLLLLGGCPQTSGTDNGAGTGDGGTSGTNTDTSGAGSTDMTTDTGSSDTSTDTTTGGDTTMSGTSMSTSELELAMDALAEINTHRAGKGLPALTWYAPGGEVGYAHCLAMKEGGFFEHTDPITGKDPATRAQEAGIVHDPDGLIDPTSGNPFVGENLYTAIGSIPSGSAAVDGWINSAGHHTQIDAPLPVSGAQTMPAWTHCGIGVHVSGNQSWWTAMFFKDPQ